MEKKSTWGGLVFIALILVHLIVIAGLDCLIHFPISCRLDTATPQVLDARLTEDRIIHEKIIGNFRLFTVEEDGGGYRLIAAEQFGFVPRCRIVEDDLPPSLPWHYYVQGKVDRVMFAVDVLGDIQVQELSEISRLVMGKYFLLTGILMALETLGYRIWKKKQPKQV